MLCVYVHRLRLRLQVLLDENDPMWIELRHQHIAIVSSQLPQRFKTFSKVSLSHTLSLTYSLTHTHSLSRPVGVGAGSERVRAMSELSVACARMRSTCDSYTLHWTAARRRSAWARRAATRARRRRRTSRSCSRRCRSTRRRSATSLRTSTSPRTA